MDAFWVYLSLTAFPLYVANASAVVFGGKTPIDGNRVMRDGQPIFGKGKTWKGTLGGIAAGSLAGVLLAYFFPHYAGIITPNYIPYAILLSIGAMAGDMIGSFIKRRMRIKSGQPAHLLDQLDFVVGGLVFGTLITLPNFTGMIILVMVTPFIHALFNRLAYMLHLKSVPW